MRIPEMLTEQPADVTTGRMIVITSSCRRPYAPAVLVTAV